MRTNAFGLGLSALCSLDDFLSSNAKATEKLRLVSEIVSMYRSECERLNVDTDSEIIQWQDDLLEKTISSWRCLGEYDHRDVVETFKIYPSDGVFKR